MIEKGVNILSVMPFKQNTVSSFVSILLLLLLFILFLNALNDTPTL